MAKGRPPPSTSWLVESPHASLPRPSAVWAARPVPGRSCRGQRAAHKPSTSIRGNKPGPPLSTARAQVGHAYVAPLDGALAVPQRHLALAAARQRNGLSRLKVLGRQHLQADEADGVARARRTRATRPRRPRTGRGGGRGAAAIAVPSAVVAAAVQRAAGLPLRRAGMRAGAAAAAACSWQGGVARVAAEGGGAGAAWAGDEGHAAGHAPGAWRRWWRWRGGRQTGHGAGVGVGCGGVCDPVRMCGPPLMLWGNRPGPWRAGPEARLPLGKAPSWRAAAFQ